MWQYIKMTNFICQGSILLFIQSFTFTSSFYKLMSKQLIPFQCIYSYIEVFFNTCCENLSCHATTFIFLNTRSWAIELASKRLGTNRGKNNMAASTNTEKSFAKYLVCVPSMYCMPGLMRLGLSWAIIFSRTVWRNCYCQIFRCFFLVDIHEFCWESVSLTPLTGSSISIANQNGSHQLVHKGASACQLQTIAVTTVAL